MKSDVLLFDPAFNFSDSLAMSDTARGASANYPTMTIDDICNLPIKDLISPTGSLLALWVPSSMLTDGLKIMNAWGFEQKQTLIWVKSKKQDSIDKLAKPGMKLNDCLGFGMGRLFRQSHEICLVGTSSNGIYKKLKNKSQRSVFLEENEGHSIKPNNLHESLEIMFEGCTMVEGYARRQRKGWFCLGNESPMTNNEDIGVSLNKLVKVSNTEIVQTKSIIDVYDDTKAKELFDSWKSLK